MLAHPFDDGSAALIERSLDATAAALGARRSGVYDRPSAPSSTTGRASTRRARTARDSASSDRAGEVRTARAALGRGLSTAAFKDEPRRARCSPASPRTACCRSIDALTAGVGLDARRDVPHRAAGRLPRGGAQRITNALVGASAIAWRRSRRGHARSTTLDELPPARRSCCAISRRGRCCASRATISGRRIAAAARALSLRHGRVQSGLGARGADSVDVADACRRAGTLHLGGTLDEIAASEQRRVGRDASPSGRSCC